MSRKKETMKPAVRKKERWKPDPILADEICALVATCTDKLDDILASDDRFPGRHIFLRWCFEEIKIGELYSLAKQRQQDLLVDMQRDIIKDTYKFTFTDEFANSKIDPGAIALAKLQCENIKWAAARLAPQKYKIKDDNPESKKNELREASEKLTSLIDKYARDS